MVGLHIDGENSMGFEIYLAYFGSMYICVQSYEMLCTRLKSWSFCTFASESRFDKQPTHSYSLCGEEVRRFRGAQRPYPTPSS